jgi:hypothetical protein
MSGGEQDVLTRWRHLLCFTHKPGACRYWKRRHQRRLRQRARREVREFN